MPIHGESKRSAPCQVQRSGAGIVERHLDDGFLAGKRAARAGPLVTLLPAKVRKIIDGYLAGLPEDAALRAYARATAVGLVQ